jgi:hypothetical protein
MEVSISDVIKGNILLIILTVNISGTEPDYLRLAYGFYLVLAWKLGVSGKEQEPRARSRVSRNR